MKLMMLLSFLFFVSSLGQASTLFFMDDSKDQRCVGKTLEFPSKVEKILFTLPNCPSQVIWDGKNKKIFYVQGQHLWQRDLGDWKNPAVDLGVLPQADVWLWTQENSGAENIFRAAYLSGSKAIAVELQEKQWVQIEMIRAKPDASLGILKSFTNKKSAHQNLLDLFPLSTCAGGFLNCYSSEPNLKKFLGDSGDKGILPLDEGRLIAFMVARGEPMRAGPPVYFCFANCERGEKLVEIKSPELSISSKGNYVAISKIPGNEHPFVYNAKTGKLAKEIPRVKAAVWIEDYGD